MARTVPARWLAQLRAVSTAEADLRFNEQVGRWEFLLPSPAGGLQSQFYGWFFDPATGVRLESDPVTGLLPFRDLDDAGMREVCRNLAATALWNRHDGQGTTRRTIQTRQRENRALRERLRQRRRDRMVDAFGEIRWGTSVAVPSTYGVSDAPHPA